LEQFVEYFKNLNELPENKKDQEIDFDSVDRENVHNILNSPITDDHTMYVMGIYTWEWMWSSGLGRWT
jgi:hypothetical protein